MVWDDAWVKICEDVVLEEQCISFINFFAF